MKDVTNTTREEKFKKNHEPVKLKQPRKLYYLLAIFIAIYYYVVLPPIHYASMDTWIFLGLILAGIIFIEAIADGMNFVTELKTSGQYSVSKLPKKYLYFLLPFVGFALIYGVSNLITSPLFISGKYANMIQIQQADFKKDFPETDLTQVPLIDRDTSQRLGNRRLGALTELVSQFEVSNEYTQININAKPYRVTPLEYAGFFKWINNFTKGIPHYLQVDTVTGKVEVKTPKSPIKYSFADKFQRNIMRHLRFNYPFEMFSKPSFEVDNDGNPFYVATTYGRNFIFREPEASGLVVVNAMTGETQKYAVDQAPAWVDRVYRSDIVLHQLQANGKYRNGFFNALFAKEGVIEPTDGYNYIPMNDDLFLYTGLTSVSSDESNIGFVLVNLRTKESKFYPVDSAEEFSAMSSAEGSVQETEYTSTFPLLVNLNGKPMYVLTLKDNSGLIRKYALVDVENYSKVYIENNVQQLLQSFNKDHQIEDNVTNIGEENLQEIQGQIENIQAVVVEGNTVYYMMIDGKVYQADISLHEKLPFINSGDEVMLQVNEKGRVREVNFEGEENIQEETESSSEEDSSQTEQTSQSVNEDTTETSEA